MNPKLRFPEFRNADAWENKLLGPYLEDCSTRVQSDTDLPVYSSTREGLKRQDAYFDGRVLLNENEYGVVPHGSFVYRHMSDDGLFKFNINETGGDIAVSKEYPVFRTKGLSSIFLLNKLNEGPDFRHFALSQKAGGTRTRLYFSKLCEWKTLLPSLPEQQKIAEFLANLDELIAAHGRKLGALKTQKAGLMQQLFPSAGEVLPSLRFPEFYDAPEWQERELGPITKRVGSGITPLGGYKNYKAEGRPFIRSQNVGWGELILDDVAFIDDELHVSFDSTEIEEFDVLLNITGASIGRSAVADSRIVGGNVNQHVCIIRLQREELNPILLNQYLLSRYGQKQIDNFQAGGNRQGLNFSQIRSFLIPLPPTEKEQARIADCLSSLDDLIVAQAQKVAALETHKKGLMQQLFPPPEEVDV